MSKPHILVLDSQLSVRTLLTSFLSGHGFRVTPCADGAAMWEVLRVGAVDLLIIDADLGGEDALGLVHRLRSEGSKAGIILASARNDMLHTIRGLELGADEFIGKPCHSRELLARVRALLRRILLMVVAPPVGEQEKPSVPAHCPTCGSRVRSKDAEGGQLGICRACGWTQFYST